MNILSIDTVSRTGHMWLLTGFGDNSYKLQSISFALGKAKGAHAMKIDELKAFVDARAKHRNTYSVDEGQISDALIIGRVHGRFVVYYFERGTRSFKTWFENEDEAVSYFLRKFESSERQA